MQMTPLQIAQVLQTPPPVTPTLPAMGMGQMIFRGGQFGLPVVQQAETQYDVNANRQDPWAPMQEVGDVIDARKRWMPTGEVGKLPELGVPRGAGGAGSNMLRSRIPRGPNTQEAVEAAPNVADLSNARAFRALRDLGQAKPVETVQLPPSAAGMEKAQAAQRLAADLQRLKAQTQDVEARRAGGVPRPDVAPNVKRMQLKDVNSGVTGADRMGVNSPIGAWAKRSGMDPNRAIEVGEMLRAAAAEKGVRMDADHVKYYLTKLKQEGKL